MKRVIPILMAVCFSVIAACGGNTSKTTETSNGQCPSPPLTLHGTTQAGGACTTPNDCIPTCCSCSSGSKSWLASTCTSNTCDSATAMCDNTRDDPKFCN